MNCACFQRGEADSVAAIMESISPWGVYFEFGNLVTGSGLLQPVRDEIAAQASAV